jgi:hypothetical protein
MAVWRNFIGAMLLVSCGIAKQVQASSIVFLPGATGYEIAGPEDAGDGGVAQVSGGSIPPALIAGYTYGLNSAVATANAFGPMISASATGDGLASAGAEYYFELVGPFDTSVPTFVSGIAGASLGPSISGVAKAYAQVQIWDVASDTLVLDLWDCVGYGCTLGGNVIAIAGSYTQSLSLSSNTEFEIELGAVANPNDASGQDSANAVADPFIQIDPSFAAANPGFSVEVSPGISNSAVSSTPEPSTFSLIILALGIMYVVHRRSHKARNHGRLEQSTGHL